MQNGFDEGVSFLVGEIVDHVLAVGRVRRRRSTSSTESSRDSGGVRLGCGVGISFPNVDAVAGACRRFEAAVGVVAVCSAARG